MKKNFESSRLCRELFKTILIIETNNLGFGGIVFEKIFEKFFKYQSDIPPQIFRGQKTKGSSKNRLYESMQAHKKVNGLSNDSFL